MSDLSIFTEKVCNQFAKKITDEVFLMIQNDRELMHQYLILARSNSIDTINQQIGKAVKNKFNLKPADMRKPNPTSTLIQSHQKFDVE